MIGIFIILLMSESIQPSVLNEIYLEEIHKVLENKGYIVVSSQGNKITIPDRYQSDVDDKSFLNGNIKPFTEYLGRELGAQDAIFGTAHFGRLEDCNMCDPTHYSNAELIEVVVEKGLTFILSANHKGSPLFSLAAFDDDEFFTIVDSNPYLPKIIMK